jgi:hypothetical protein
VGGTGDTATLRNLFGLSKSGDCGLEIDKVPPNSTRALSARDVVINFHPQNLSIDRCRFGAHVVVARKQQPDSVACEALALPARRVYLTISEDGRTFCGEALFTFEKRNFPMAYIWVACAVGFAAAGAVFWAKRKTAPQVRENTIYHSRRKTTLVPRFVP